MSLVNNIPISQWAEDDRPREKFLLKGRNALSDSELLAILIGSGNRNESAVDLCKRILSESGGLGSLAKYSVGDLTQFEGIGEAKAISIIAALELGRRRRQSVSSQQMIIRSSSDAYEVFYPALSDVRHEEFWVLLLNRANMVIQLACLSKGGLSGTVADAKTIFKQAIDKGACSIIVAHNHPSGSLKPSQADKQLTRKLVEAGRVLELPVLDHLIIGDESYFSFADENMI